MHGKLGSATLSQLAFPREGNPNFPSVKSHWGNTVKKKIIQSKKVPLFESDVKYLAHVNPSKAPGSDGLRDHVLKGCVDHLSFFTGLFFFFSGS